MGDYNLWTRLRQYCAVLLAVALRVRPVTTITQKAKPAYMVLTHTAENTEQQLNQETKKWK
jgi:hypothetical protein